MAHHRQVLQQAGQRRQAAAEALRLCRLDVAVTEALCDVLLVWAPACFALGWRVRQCHWEHQAPGTGHRAREVLQMALLMLLHLEAPGRPSGGTPGRGDPRRSFARSEYVRTIAGALLQWEPWHDALPACCYSEEINEASLSRLGSAMRQHPEATSTAAVMDLYLLVRQGHAGYRKIEPGGVDEQWRRLCLDHLDALLARTDPATPAPQRRLVSDMDTYATQRRAAQTAETVDRGEEEGPPVERSTQPHWPDGWTGPPCLTDLSTGPKAVGDLEEVLQGTLRLLLRDTAAGFRPEVEEQMDALCERRSHADVEAFQRAWDLAGDRRPPRPPRPSPKPKSSGGPFLSADASLPLRNCAKGDMKRKY